MPMRIAIVAKVANQNSTCAVSDFSLELINAASWCLPVEIWTSRVQVEWFQSVVPSLEEHVRDPAGIPFFRPDSMSYPLGVTFGWSRGGKSTTGHQILRRFLIWLHQPTHPDLLGERLHKGGLRLSMGRNPDIPQAKRGGRKHGSGHGIDPPYTGVLKLLSRFRLWMLEEW